MSPCRLIVCEKNSHFAPALRGELGQKPPPVVETRSLPGCAAALAESPESLLAIEATPANLELVITFLGQAGAIAVFASVLESPRLAQLAHRKHLQSTLPELTVQEFVNERLPWPV